ncbi:MAG: hypothetical protein QOG33_317 [Gaiellales bacterium]|nr:hypothetical protein [Gaiellales bacterium]
MTHDQPTERFKNPHRLAPRPPLVKPHPFRPANLGAGLALTGLGVLSFAQQLGRVALGPVFTGSLVLCAAALLLVAVAIGWSRRAGREGRPEVASAAADGDETLVVSPDADHPVQAQEDGPEAAGGPES